MSRQGPWVEVDLGALQRNARRYAERVGVPLLPMVKAGGYGLGSVAVARALEPLGPWGFGVATLEEARVLRDAGIERPVIAFLPFVPARVADYLAFGVRPAIGSVEGLATWVGRTDQPFHLEIDTGMSRAGVRWHDADGLARVRELVAGAAGFEGAFTHFASADSSLEATAAQWSRFEAAIAGLGRRPRLLHAANSAAGQWGPRFAADLARPGIFLYGGRAGEWEPEPVGQLQAPVVAVRAIRRGDPVSYGETWRAPTDGEVATLAIGYADGVPRSLSSRGTVEIAGATWPIAGRVTMDMTMTFTRAGVARVGDTASLWGGAIPLDRQAELAGTISYQLVTGLGPRVARRYGGTE